MRPEVVVLMGSFISQENTESESFEKFKMYFEQVGQLIRENECLRDLTQWVLMPSMDDPGIMKIFPNFKLSDYLTNGMKGIGPNRIKKVMLATNPMRISFRGKEIVFCRYNYFKKLKRNHMEKFQEQQLKQQKEDPHDFPDSLKVAKTILHQGSLLPLAPII
jgi:hypothetical protein